MSEDSDIAALGEILDERSKARRASNRVSSAELLKASGVDYETRNGGVHLMIQREGWRIDFWPGTGLWRAECRSKNLAGKSLVSKASGRGVFALLSWMGVEARQAP